MKSHPHLDDAVHVWDEAVDADFQQHDKSPAYVLPDFTVLITSQCKQTLDRKETWRQGKKRGCVAKRGERRARLTNMEGDKKWNGESLSTLKHTLKSVYSLTDLQSIFILCLKMDVSRGNWLAEVVTTVHPTYHTNPIIQSDCSH